MSIMRYAKKINTIGNFCIFLDITVNLCCCFFSNDKMSFKLYSVQLSASISIKFWGLTFSESVARQVRPTALSGPDQLQEDVRVPGHVSTEHLVQAEVWCWWTTPQQPSMRAPSSHISPPCALGYKSLCALWSAQLTAEIRPRTPIRKPSASRLSVKLSFQQLLWVDCVSCDWLSLTHCVQMLPSKCLLVIVVVCMLLLEISAVALRSTFRDTRVGLNSSKEEICLYNLPLLLSTLVVCS